MTTRPNEPLSAVATRLTEVDVENWRPYGWATFELSYALYGPSTWPEVLSHHPKHLAPG
ncbi:hypothetical protein AB0M48_32305 [Lentzea sp. NPDC051208]|uniref:hypothetical protein n=1 Tax=Lentzea sp. NPDC051208 TaxID=3154642 RepID=UPI0034257D5E